jgi:pimeloyl-ACP methyl ester carboxylesterase
MIRKVCLAALLLVLAAPLAALPPPQAEGGLFARAPCPASVQSEDGIECGVLTVPENRQRAGSRMIRLPVVIFRSHASAPAPDAVVFLPGGPGGSALARPLSAKNNPFLATRDYVLLEPRGAKLAQPSLGCPEINALVGVIAAGHLSGKAADTARVKAAMACRADLVAKGIDLDGYTSAETAQDIEDLRKALGYRQWNLFGLSYGTRLALTVLRDHPQGIRSVILDSVLPPEANFDEHATANFRRALDAVFNGCAVDTVCGSMYPHLAADFTELVARADRHPLAMPGVSGSDGRAVTVRGAQVVAALYDALHAPSAIGRIPAVIEDSLEGRTTELAGLVKADQGPSSFTWGLRLSVWCAEEAPFENPSRVEQQVSPVWGMGGIDERTASPAVCRAWNVAAAAPSENVAVTSDVPVLVFAGEFDPDTPPEWGRGLIPHIPNARVVTFPGQSHGAGFNPCGAAIATAFLHDPGGSLPLDCVLKMHGTAFTTSGGAKEEGQRRGHEKTKRPTP